MNRFESLGAERSSGNIAVARHATLTDLTMLTTSSNLPRERSRCTGAILMPAQATHRLPHNRCAYPSLPPQISSSKHSVIIPSITSVKRLRRYIYTQNNH
jgi:hypothetical protein